MSHPLTAIFVPLHLLPFSPFGSAFLWCTSLAWAFAHIEHIKVSIIHLQLECSIRYACMVASSAILTISVITVCWMVHHPNTFSGCPVRGRQILNLLASPPVCQFAAQSKVLVIRNWEVLVISYYWELVSCISALIQKSIWSCSFKLWLSIRCYCIYLAN